MAVSLLAPSTIAVKPSTSPNKVTASLSLEFERPRELLSMSLVAFLTVKASTVIESASLCTRSRLLSRLQLSLYLSTAASTSLCLSVARW